MHIVYHPAARLVGDHRKMSMETLCQFHFAGNLAHMDDSRLPRKLMVSSLASGKHTVGGQMCRWNDPLARDLKKIGLGEKTDRQEWR